MKSVIYFDAAPKSVWLNPESPSIWGADSVRMIREVFPMYPMSYGRRWRLSWLRWNP